MKREPGRGRSSTSFGTFCGHIRVPLFFFFFSRTRPLTRSLVFGIFYMENALALGTTKRLSSGFRQTQSRFLSESQEFRMQSRCARHPVGTFTREKEVGHQQCVSMAHRPDPIVHTYISKSRRKNKARPKKQLGSFIWLGR